MRAIVVHGPGGPEALRFEQHEQHEQPSAAPGQLLVETAAIGVNFIETYQRSGQYNVPFPFTPGAEASGTVIEVGEGVTGFSPGDHVTTAEAKGTYAERFVVSA